MATLSIDVPNEQVPRIKAALEGLYPVEAEQYTTAQSLAQFLIRRYIRELVIAYEAQQAAESARVAKIEEVEAANPVPEPQV